MNIKSCGIFLKRKIQKKEPKERIFKFLNLPILHRGEKENKKRGEVMNYSNKYKYPSTPHLQTSQHVEEDDIVLQGNEHFEGEEIVVTEKMDGENASLYSNYYHARSLDFNRHPSRNWMKNLHGRIKGDIPKGWRICGENLYAEHSIRYENLESYFYVFSIWNDSNECLSWRETEEWCEMLNLAHVPVLYKGIWNEEKIHEIIDSLNTDKQEGIVIRTREGFSYEDFQNHIAKWVRSNHVEKNEKHWMHQEIVPNGLEEE